MRQRREVRIDNERLNKAIEVSTLPRSRGAAFHNLITTLSNQGQCLDVASENKLFLNCKMNITLVVEKTLIATHYFIDYMSNMTSIIQISIPLHTDMSS